MAGRLIARFRGTVEGVDKFILIKGLGWPHDHGGEAATAAPSTHDIFLYRSATVDPTPHFFIYLSEWKGGVRGVKKKRKILFFITMIKKNFCRGFAPRHTPPGAYAAPWTPREFGRGWAPVPPLSAHSKTQFLPCLQQHSFYRFSSCTQECVTPCKLLYFQNTYTYSIYSWWDILWW